MNKVGITERGDAALDFDQIKDTIISVYQNTSKLDGIILITKDPASLISSLTANVCLNLKHLRRHPIIIHCTITGWGKTFLEPCVPTARNSLLAYDRLVAALGPEKVVLRIDPIIPNEEGIKRARKVYRKSQGRVRISFLDAYPHVRMRINEEHRGFLPFEKWNGLHAGIALRQEVDAKVFGEKNLNARSGLREICGEPGFGCSGCVSERDYRAFGLPKPQGLKTSGQRPVCKCLTSKKELLTRKQPCAHGCLYCYWKG